MQSIYNAYNFKIPILINNFLLINSHCILIMCFNTVCTFIIIIFFYLKKEYNLHTLYQINEIEIKQKLLTL